jgi:hypothetical protein
MELDGLLGFLDGPVVLTFTDLTAVLVADGIEGQQLGIVVLVALLLLQVTVDEGLLTIEISVVSCVECMPPTRLRIVLLSRTGQGEEDRGS